MPSGSKKRKAAKKKMVKEEKEPNYTPHAHAHGYDDLKHYDEKDSDGGEVSSPASQEHRNHQHPFAEGEDEEVEKREDRSSVRSYVTENKSMEGNNYGDSMPETATEEEGVVQIAVDVKYEEDFESKNVIIESAKESHDGDSSGSSSSSTSSSSSDDESQVLEEEKVVVETAPPPFDSVKPIDLSSEVVTEVNDSFPVEEANNWVVETASAVDLDKVSVLENVVHVNEGALVDNSMISGMVESGSKENGETKLPSLDENIGVSPVVIDLEPKKNEDETVLTSYENAASEENGETKLPSLDENIEVSPVVSDLEPKKNEDKTVLTSYENAASSSDAKDCRADVNEDKLMLSFNAPSVDTSNGAKHAKDSETPECSDAQPLVASVPRKVQTTDWKSCCGIFELFTGSNR